MSKLFHVNPDTGEARPCGATKDRCPFGSADAHFGSAEEARNAYEAAQGATFGELKWEQTARGWERGSFVVRPNTRVGGYTVFELEEINGKLVPARERVTNSSLKGAKALAVELEDLKIQDAAKEGARRGQNLLAGLDMAYRREQRKTAETSVDDLQAGMEDIIANHKSSFPPVDPEKEKEYPAFMRRTPENEAASRAKFRRNMLDMVEGRSGEPLSPDSLITVGEHEGTAEELAEVLEPLAYEGTYTNPETGEREPAFIGVYSDGTAQAFARDLRKDDDFRQKLAAAKPAQLKEMETEFDDAMADAKSEEETLAYGAAAALASEARRNTDWADPASAAEGLENLYELVEDFEKRGWDDESKTTPYYGKIAERIEQITKDQYYLAGVQKLNPMKKSGS